MAFHAEHAKVPLPQGWNSVINAKPELLLKRGFDKIIYVSRDEMELAKVLAKYHRKVSSLEEAIELAMNEPKFFSNIRTKRLKLEKEIDDPRFFRYSLIEWDNWTVKTFNRLLDFLEFPKERNILMLIAKPNRNFEGYSCDHLEPEQPVCENVQRIREEC